MTGPIRTIASALVLAAAFALPAGNAEESKAPAKKAITADEVNAAQQAWCDGLVAIGKAYADKKDYKAVAEKMIADLYDFKEGAVFFKPTLAFGPNTFRKTAKGTLSYFVGGDKDFPEDTGFALKPWVKCRYDNVKGNEGIQIHGEIALTMGNVYFTDADGKEIYVDKTFAFRRGSDGKLRLCVHKSALPFTPAK